MTFLTSCEERLARLASLLAAALYDSMRGVCPEMALQAAAAAIIETPIEDDVYAAGQQLAAILHADILAGHWPLAIKVDGEAVLKTPDATSRHTPGPWSLAVDGTIRSQAFGRSDMMGDYLGVIVCDIKPAVGSDSWPAVGRRHAQPEAEANAAVITAAPSLLANLRYALWCLENPGIPPTPAALDNMRAAIAAALGVEGGDHETL